jgi:hypothetical protein
MIVNALFPNIWRIVARALTQVSGQYGGRIYYEVAPAQISAPYLVYQMDPSLGSIYGMLNTTAWKGIITFRSLSTSLAEASDSLGDLLNKLNYPIVVSGIPNITIPYDVQFYPYKSYSFPVERINNSAVYTSAVGVETYITPKLT